LADFAHQELPFSRLVEELRPRRDPAYTPVFQVGFGLQREPASPNAGEETFFETSEIDTGTSKFDLTLTLREGNSGCAACLEYNTDLFDAATVTRAAGHWLTLLQSAISNPQQRISTISLLTDQERRAMAKWNATDREFPRHLCVHQLVEEQAERNP